MFTSMSAACAISGSTSHGRAETAALTLDDECRVEFEVLRHRPRSRRGSPTRSTATPRAAGVDARGRRDLLEEEHIVTEPLEPEGPRQPRPGRAAVGRLVRERPGHDYGRHTIS